jgi:hypothetical protein
MVNLVILIKYCGRSYFFCINLVKLRKHQLLTNLDVLHFQTEGVTNKGCLHRLMQRGLRSPFQEKKTLSQVNLRNRFKMLGHPTSPLDVAILYD